MLKKNQTTWDNPLKLNLQFFADDSDSSDNQPSDDSTDDKGDNTNNQDSQDKDDKQQDKDDKTSDISAEEAQRIAEAQLLKDLGVNSLDDAKNNLKAYNEYQDSKKTDDQKTQDRLETLEKEAKGKDDTIFDLQSKLAASNAGVLEDSVEDVVALAKTKVSDKKTIEKAIKEVVEKYPQFTASNKEADNKPSGVFPGNNPGRKTDKVDGFISGLGLKQ